MRPGMASQMVFKKVAAPLAVGTSMQTRPVATQKMTPTDSYDILVQQRKKRPTSPNLGIYKPQITWILSSLNRVTGLTVAVPFYLFGLAYLASPLRAWLRRLVACLWRRSLGSSLPRRYLLRFIAGMGLDIWLGIRERLLTMRRSSRRGGRLWG